MFGINKNRKLKHYIIFPKFQLTLVITNLVIMTFCYVLVFYQIYDSFNHLTEIGMRLRIPEDSAFFKLLNHHESAIINKLLIAAGLSYLFSFIMTVVISHRVSGPLYNLKNYFLELKEKGFTREIKFRKGDYYSDLPHIINDGLKKVKED